MNLPPENGVRMPLEKFSVWAIMRIARKPEFVVLELEVFFTVVKVILQLPTCPEMVVWGYGDIAGVEQAMDI